MNPGLGAVTLIDTDRAGRGCNIAAPSVAAVAISVRSSILTFVSRARVAMPTDSLGPFPGHRAANHKHCRRSSLSVCKLWLIVAVKMPSKIET